MKKIFSIIFILIIVSTYNGGLKASATSSAEAVSVAKVITLEAGIKKVVVVPKEYDFSSEAEEFTEFRRRYVSIWTIFFMSAFIIPYVW